MVIRRRVGIQDPSGDWPNKQRSEGCVPPTNEVIDIRSCGVLVYREDPRRAFLLMKHADRWDLPKGHVDENESDVDCALRELREETGIDPRRVEVDTDFRFVHRYPVTRGQSKTSPRLKELVVFLARLKSPAKIHVTEHDGYRWFEWAPPHKIQSKTIDPLLAAVEKHWERK
jgi:8-oxo-dGTP pyrophosphatase MutT (NUDIX family)